MKVGRRLAMKLLNASRFALAAARAAWPGHRCRSTAPCSRASRGSWSTRPGTSRATTTRARSQRTKRFFWRFCDDYLELVKSRRYGDAGTEVAAASATAALLAALSVLLRLFAPFLPFVTEEVWSWWMPGSVHTARWPEGRELLDLIGGADDGAATALERAALVLGEVRKTKSEARRKLSTPVERLVVRDTREHLDALRAAEADLVSSGFVQALVLEESDGFGVEVLLADAGMPATGQA